jgi:hypothetical protein
MVGWLLKTEYKGFRAKQNPHAVLETVEVKTL